MSRSEQEAFKNFINENQVKTIDERDAIYQYDNEKYQQILQQKPWTKNPNYFKKVKISAVALVKMAMHARSGGNIEVMGLMQGKVMDDTMVIMDSYALPVEGTETRVNAQNQGNEYIFEYLRLVQKVGRIENPIGWYHSHPGYGCWLSGIDVETQMTNQQYQDPFLAVVIDPTRSASAGKVEIGAFRTYPAGYKPADEGLQEYQTIPLSKIEDFGVHCKQYYPVEVSFFKSASDSHILSLLWNKYWVNTLSSNSLLANREFLSQQINDISEKLEQAETHSNAISLFTHSTKKNDGQLTKAARDGCKFTVETTNGLVSHVVKNVLFNSSLGSM